MPEDMAPDNHADPTLSLGRLSQEPVDESLRPGDAASAAPDAPEVPPVDPGQGDDGQGDGQGQDGGSWAPDVQAEFTRRQQAFAEERRQLEEERDWLRQQIMAGQAPQQAPQMGAPDIPPEQLQAFTSLAKGAGLYQGAATVAALAAETRLASRENFDKPGVRERVLQDVANAASDPRVMNNPVALSEAVEMAYDRHTRKYRADASSKVQQLQNQLKAMQAQIQQFQQQRVRATTPGGSATRAAGVSQADLTSMSNEQLREHLSNQMAQDTDDGW